MTSVLTSEDQAFVLQLKFNLFVIISFLRFNVNIIASKKKPLLGF